MTSGERTRRVRIYVAQCPKCGEWAAAHLMDYLADCVDCAHTEDLIYTIVEANIPTTHVVVEGEVRDAE